MGLNHDRNGRDNSQSRNLNSTGYGNAVANRTARNTPSQAKINPVQKASKPEDEEQLQMKKAPVQQKSEEEEQLQMKEAPVQQKSEEEEIQMKKAGGSGSGKMPEEVQAKMENSFGTDFSDVNIHSNSDSASQMGALAYAQGTDVHFSPGQYNPGSQKGQELLGHELTHVVQQKQGRVKATTQAKGVAVNDDKGLEKEADVMGTKAAKGESASVSGTSLQPAVQKKEGGESNPEDKKNASSTFEGEGYWRPASEQGKDESGKENGELDVKGKDSKVLFDTVEFLYIDTQSYLSQAHADLQKDLDLKKTAYGQMALCYNQAKKSFDSTINAQKTHVKAKEALLAEVFNIVCGGVIGRTIKSFQLIAQAKEVIEEIQNSMDSTLHSLAGMAYGRVKQTALSKGAAKGGGIKLEDPLNYHIELQMAVNSVAADVLGLLSGLMGNTRVYHSGLVSRNLAKNGNLDYKKEYKVAFDFRKSIITQIEKVKSEIKSSVENVEPDKVEIEMERAMYVYWIPSGLSMKKKVYVRNPDLPPGVSPKAPGYGGSMEGPGTGFIEVERTHYVTNISDALKGRLLATEIVKDSGADFDDRFYFFGDASSSEVAKMIKWARDKTPYKPRSGYVPNFLN